MTKPAARLTVGKLTVTCCLAAAIAGGLVFARPGVAQTAGKADGKVGLIDMAYVFKEYDKFKALQEDLAAEAKSIDAGLREKVQTMQSLQKQLQSGQLAANSPEAKQIEERLISMQTDLETQRKVQQRDFLRKESEIYKTVYVEVQETVKLFCEAKGYDVILRFSRNKVDDASNPQAILQSMNRQVVHFDPSDDITDPILRYLDGQFAKNAGN